MPAQAKGKAGELVARRHAHQGENDEADAAGDEEREDTRLAQRPEHPFGMARHQIAQQEEGEQEEEALELIHVLHVEHKRDRSDRMAPPRLLAERD